MRHLDKKGIFDAHEAGDEVLIAALTDFVAPILNFIGGATVSQLEPKFARKKDALEGKTKTDVLDLVETIISVTVDALKANYGTSELASGEKAYWDLGIESSKVKEEAYKKQQMAPRD